jgi:Lrp/AsnC family transcriptional regulator, regulator for asnA, asnC and gidA
VKKVLDKLDFDILHVLRDNARTPFLEIAKKLTIPESTIRHRVKSLEDKGVIKKYGVQIDPSKLGFSAVAYVGIDVQPEKFLHVAKSLTEFENVRMVATTSGDHMIMTEIWGEKASELRSFISERIERISGVTRTCPAIITERLKES